MLFRMLAADLLNLALYFSTEYHNSREKHYNSAWEIFS
jgi:hypothetical protein